MLKDYSIFFGDQMKQIIILLTLILTTSAYALTNPPLGTVNYVDIERYLGKWYEVARFEQKFQKGCTSVTAEYSLREDGDIKVKNECRLGSINGKLKSSIARAWVIDKETNAKLKVQFFLSRFKIPFLSGNYWILDLGADYEYAIVGDDSRDYLWFLSRTKRIDEGLFTDLVNKAKDMGFDTSKLMRTQHD